ncbi:MAG: L-lysine 6-transaminase [Ignavibacteria bacterium]|nr:L-lysine 6-transaminase [Ignavibacteria bacterium]
MSSADIRESLSLQHKSIDPTFVHAALRKYMLIDGFDLVLDLKKSHGLHFVDAKTNDTYLDFFSFFASSPLGMNHPKLQNDEFKEKLLEASMHKPSNSDIYSTLMAEFVETFASIAKPDHFKYLFFIDGGTLAVENGLKVAFDWKVQKNFKKGYTKEVGTKVLHFNQAFHGRSGYTLSLTNTDPNKINYFPKFDWPRIINPKVIFPLEANLAEVIRSEETAVAQIYQAIKDNPDDIAVIILEPIQGEGGDNFFRKEFFLKLRQIADENDILLMFDEVQTGMGMTGKMWASEYYVLPDIISFGKKSQTCGIMVSGRIDDVEEHCFRKSSRINSTWGSNLPDMVRSTRILEVMQEDNLLAHVNESGDYLLHQLNILQLEYPTLIEHARGLGLMCAFDFKSADLRNEYVKECYKNKLLQLGCGGKSVRFRTPLIVTNDELDEGLKIIRKVLNSLRK